MHNKNLRKEIKMSIVINSSVTIFTEMYNKIESCYLKLLHNNNYIMSESLKETIVSEVYKIIYEYKERKFCKYIDIAAFIDDYDNLALKPLNKGTYGMFALNNYKYGQTYGWDDEKNCEIEFV